MKIKITRFAAVVTVLSLSLLSFSSSYAATPIVTSQSPEPFPSFAPGPAPAGANIQHLIIELGTAAALAPLGPVASANAVVVFLDCMVNLGSTLWDVVASGEPSAKFDENLANALPQGVTSPMDLDNWQQPVVREYCVPLTPDPDFNCDQAGSDGSHFFFRVSFVPGGSLQGHGKFLSSVLLEPEAMTVNYGRSFFAQTSVESVDNIGTEEDPVASMKLKLTWTSNEYFGRPYGQSLDFVISGDGTITHDPKTTVVVPIKPVWFIPR
jgi:hypothetical protein